MAETTNLQFAHIGMNFVVQVNRVIAVIPPHLKPAKRFLEIAKNKGMHIDASRGRPFRSELILDDGYVVTSALNVKTVLKRFSVSQDDYPPDDFIEDDAEDIIEADTEGE